MVSNLPGFIAESTLPQWITAFFGGGTFVALLRLLLAWRKQSLESEEQIRDHYSTEVAALRDQLQKIETHYRRMIADSDDRHEKCQEDRDLLRERVKHLEDEVSGLRRQIVASSADRVISLSGSEAPEARASAYRVKNHTEKPK